MESTQTNRKYAPTIFSCWVLCRSPEAAAFMVNNQQTRSITQQTTIAATDYYKRLTEELNKCFDDIELFVRYLEALMEYTKELERDHRRKEKKSTGSLSPHALRTRQYLSSSEPSF